MAINRAMVLRAAVHVAVWLPFLATVADSLRSSWRVVGDGAVTAMLSWNALTGNGPLVGQATQLAAGVHDPGPLEYWLLAVPVHVEPVRGVLWGAALWSIVAASLAVEAAWSVLGEIGGLLAAGAILGLIAWMPEIASAPYWNPYFGTMFFVAALATGWAVMSGRRWWWPVLVVSASVAAEAHLMFAIASAALVFVALIVGLVAAFRAKSGYWWVLAGLILGMGCWSAPFIEQFSAKTGNLTKILRGQAAGSHAGLGFALKTMTAVTQPPPIWWRSVPQTALGPARLIDGRPAAFAVVVLVVTAAVMVLAMFRFRSRPLAAFAAVSLVADAAALVTFSRIPLRGASLSKLNYLLIVMYPVGLFAWLIVGSALILTARQVIPWLQERAARSADLGGGQQDAEPGSGRQDAERGWPRWAARTAGIAAIPLILLAALPAVMRQTPWFPGDAPIVAAVSDASPLIERALPSQQMALSVASSDVHYCHRLSKGLVWALSAAGYEPEVTARSTRKLRIPQVTVLVRSGSITVLVKKRTKHHPGACVALTAPAHGQADP